MTRVIAVTGANSGIGQACCRALLATGATVHALDVNTDALEPDEKLHVHHCDVGDESSVQAAFARIGEETGRLDALVCSAGVLRPGSLADMATEDFDTVFRVNTRGPWLCARAALPLLTSVATADSPARVVMVASIAAVRPKAGGGAYAASKAALAQLVRVLAVELADRHVRVNAVAPSTVDTPMIRSVGNDSPTGYRPSGLSPLGRIAVPDDVVGVIRFLLDGGSDYVTGALIPVDGGISAAIPAT
jgi:NAD(P)-dependent dehydrogenase (short-subunit alcohol dehydrogenase family)